MVGKDPLETKDTKNPYARPPEKGFPLPEQPLWKGHSWQPTGVTYDWGTGMFSDGYKPKPSDKPAF
jgi:hypothetical protein